MKNKNWVIGIILLVAIIGLLIYAFFRNNNNSAPQSEYTPSQISADVNVTNNNGVNNSTTNTTANENVKKVETKVGGFSTPIVDDNKNRVNNIKITCSRINGTIVKPGEEFSFCDVVGQPSADDGYKEAHAFVNGKLVNAIGGGNCQVSTTLYNAAKETDGVKITERHEHGKPVGYIEMGKDATVAYDYLDLKFKNNNDHELKLKAYVKNKKVCVEVFKLSS